MNLNNVDLNKIRVFYAVVENGNYQRAGEELGLTRSAISQSITTLEAQLGVSLFQRKGKRLFPTLNARDLATEFSQYQKKLGEILTKIKDDDNEVEGVVRIGSYFEFAKVELVKIIKEYGEQFPKVQFRLIFDSPSKLQSHLESGKIDMSFSIYQHGGPSEIESLKVFEQELVLIAPKSMSAQALDLDSLLKLPVIEYFKTHQVLPKWIRMHFQNKRPRLNPRVFASSAEMLIEFVDQGLGIGVAPLYLVNAKGSNGIKVIRPTPKRLIDYIWLNQYVGQFENAAHRSFYDWLVQRRKNDYEFGRVKI